MTNRNFFKATVKVVIGKGKERVVPKDRLCEVSEFFSVACSDRWASGRVDVIELEEDDPQIFGLFLSWAFDGRIENSEDYVVVDDTETVYAKGSFRTRHY